MAPKSKSAFYAENPVHPTRCRPRRCLIYGANSAAVLPGAAEARTGGQTCALQTARGPHTAPRGRRRGRGPTSVHTGSVCKRGTARGRPRGPSASGSSSLAGASEQVVSPASKLLGAGSAAAPAPGPGAPPQRGPGDAAPRSQPRGLFPAGVKHVLPWAPLSFTFGTRTLTPVGFAVSAPRGRGPGWRAGGGGRSEAGGGVRGAAGTGDVDGFTGRSAFGVLGLPRGGLLDVRHHLRGK